MLDKRDSTIYDYLDKDTMCCMFKVQPDGLFADMFNDGTTCRCCGCELYYPGNCEYFFIKLWDKRGVGVLCYHCWNYSYSGPRLDI